MISKKEKQEALRQQQEQEKELHTPVDAGTYYKINKKAVEDLANANESNSPEVSEKEINQYKSKGKIKIPNWLKVLFIKFWFNGAICFFFFWGLGTYITNQLDIMVVVAVAMGILTDVLVNNLLRWMAGQTGSNDKWMMFPKKAYSSFFLNILYAFAIFFCVVILYNVINYAYMDITGDTETIFLGVEPILYGLFYLGFDMLFIGFKNLMKKIISDAKKQVSASGSERK